MLTNTTQQGQHLHTIEEIQALNAEASTMTATCPTCNRDGRNVRPAIKQATRQSPAVFLGWTGYCNCGGMLVMGFPVENAQTTLV